MVNYSTSDLVNGLSVMGSLEDLLCDSEETSDGYEFYIESKNIDVSLSASFNSGNSSVTIFSDIAGCTEINDYSIEDGVVVISDFIDGVTSAMNK